MTADTEPANRHVLNEDNWKNKEKVNVTFTFCFHIFSPERNQRINIELPCATQKTSRFSDHDHAKTVRPIRKQEKRTFTPAFLT